ncbi:hypothetical protein F4780DRAFT_74877 [Xylariomycetidae sp. FL0641]|nr:hypothetical protein F4780DRAFT_74877 [Xylariomycetidae sp. FL0641]
MNGEERRRPDRPPRIPYWHILARTGTHFIFPSCPIPTGFPVISQSVSPFIHSFIQSPAVRPSAHPSSSQPVSAPACSTLLPPPIRPRTCAIPTRIYAYCGHHPLTRIPLLWSVPGNPAQSPHWLCWRGGLGGLGGYLKNDRPSNAAVPTPSPRSLFPRLNTGTSGCAGTYLPVPLPPQPLAPSPPSLILLFFLSISSVIHLPLFLPRR